MQFLKRLAIENDLHRRQLWLFPAPWAWGMLLALAVIILSWLPFASFTLVVNEDLVVAVLVAGLLLGLGLLNVSRASPRLGALLQGISFFILVGILGRIFNYLATGIGLPFQDAPLARINELLGFDFQAHVLWLNAHPMLMQALGLAYSSYGWLIPFTIVGLALLGRQARLREFLLLFAVTGLLSVAVGAFVPALAAYAYYGLSPAGLENIPVSGISYLSDLQAVHAGSLGELFISEAVGLTTFPSFHTVMALTFAWAWRGTWLQWPVGVLSALTILSTPVMGGHYLADIPAGLLVFVAVLKGLETLGISDGSGRAWRRMASGRSRRGAVPRAAE